MNVTEIFWNASLKELKNGFTKEESSYVCLLCGKRIEKGIVYPFDGIFYEAKSYMGLHIRQEHGSVFEFLINMDKKLTGLSDHQSSLLRLFYKGKRDEDIQKEMGIGSSSTIRNHRFVLKEKERQAKVFLVMMELLKENNAKPLGLITPHTTAKMVDERYSLTEEENEKILKKYFTNGPEGPLKTFEMKEKSRIAVLRQIVKRFKTNSIYIEKEVNEILKNVYKDFVTVRRYLIEYGFMDRKPDGSQYWVKEESNEMENKRADQAINDQEIIDQARTGQMVINQAKAEQINTEQKIMEQNSLKHRKELIRQYKEIKTAAGVYQIKNVKNSKVYLASTVNLKTMNGKQMMLDGGVHKNKRLQEDWNKFGKEAFVFEVLEVLREKEDGFFDKAWELKNLEKKWLEKLQPYGELGYN